jgi:hypothetical protein
MDRATDQPSEPCEAICPEVIGARLRPPLRRRRRLAAAAGGPPMALLPMRRPRGGKEIDGREPSAGPPDGGAG